VNFPKTAGTNYQTARPNARVDANNIPLRRIAKSWGTGNVTALLKRLSTAQKQDF
jgi:hypothetical protein